MIQEQVRNIHPVDLVTPYEQQQDGTCGEAVLVMCYEALGERVSEEQLVGEIKPWLGTLDSKYMGGTLPKQMQDNALLHGYQADYKNDVPYEYLIDKTKDGLPVIVEWMTDVDGETESDSHYSVVTYADSDKVKMADPSEGKWRTMDRENFERKWLGFERDGSMSKHFAMVIYES